MFKTIADFELWWSGESQSTLKVMRALTDASLGQAVAPGGRTLGRIAWHIVQTIGEMGGAAGLKIEGANEHTPQPTSASAIASAYEANAQAVAKAVTTAWKDADLPGEIEMYGEKWARSKALMALVAHEGHHRGQMTVLMRQAGLKVPGVYGPAKEEWATYGMPAQE
jgi:uncharacterized damage-inducible protein DinB